MCIRDRTVVTQYNVIDVLGAKKNEVYKMASKDLQEMLKSEGVELIQLTIKDMNAGDEIETVSYTHLGDLLLIILLSGHQAALQRTSIHPDQILTDRESAPGVWQCLFHLFYLM